MTTVRVRPGAADEVRAAWASLLDTYTSTGVFGGLLSLHDERAGTAVTVTFWSSAEAADAAAEQLRPLAVATFGELLQSTPSVEAFDVLLLARTDGSGSDAG